MKLFKDALDKVFVEQQHMNLFDGISIHALQEINSVGKQTVGVMANGIKVLFALTQYYNQFYKDNPSAQEIIDSYTWFNNKLTLLVNDESGNETRKTFQTSFVADTRIIEERIAELSKTWADILGNTTKPLYYNNNTASLQQSSLISLATDNAKELALAKMNAGIKLASIHVYLTLLGIDPETIVQFTTSKPFNKFNEMIQSNLFVDGEEKRIDINLFEKFLSWGKNNGYYDDCIQIMRLYKMSDEITELARILGVNQGVKVDLFKANGLLTGFQNVLANRLKDLHENLLVINASSQGKQLKDLRDLTQVVTKDELPLLDVSNLTSALALTHDTRRGKVLEYYGTKINRANDIIKKYNIDITKPIDMIKYFAEPEYRKAITDIYDVVKSTYNVYDVINKSSNFYAMLQAYSQSMEEMKALSAKARFILDSGTNGFFDTDLLDFRANDLKYFSYNNRNAQRAIKFFDDYVVSDFLRNQNLQITLPFNNKTLHKLYKIDFKDNQSIEDFIELMNYIVIPALRQLERKTIKENPTLPHEIDLNHAIQAVKDNEFLRSIRLYQDNDTGQTKYVANFNIDQINSDYDTLKYQNFVGGFNRLLDIKLGTILQRTSQERNKGLDMTFGDLMYLYNLILNQDSIGQRSLTKIFDKYITDAAPESLSQRLIEYYKLYDDDKKRIEPTLENKEKFLYFLLRGKITPERTVVFKSGNKISNGYKGLLGLLTNGQEEADNKALEDAAKVTSALNNGSLSVNYQC